MIKDDRT